MYEWYSSIAEKRMSEKVRFFVADFFVSIIKRVGINLRGGIL